MYDERRARERLLEVLDYAAAGLDALDRHERYAGAGSPTGEAGARREGGSLLRQRDKVAAEALLLAFLASRVPSPGPALSAAVERVVDRAEAEIATSRNEAMLRRFPATTTTIGQGFVLLAKMGRPRPAIEALLRRALARGWATIGERVPYRLMDSRWTFGQLDPSLLGSPGELARYSILGARPHPIHTARDDDYALTHALFYLTDFGRQLPPADLRRRASALLDPFVAWNAVRDDLDLLGEMLISALVLRAPATPAVRFGWEVLERAWGSPDGLVGPDWSAERHAALDGDEAAAYAFFENYHTTFVGGILCAVTLTVSPPPAAAGSAGPLGAGDPFAALASPCLGSAARALGGGRLAEGLSLPAPEDLPEWTSGRLLRALGAPAGPAPRWLATAAESALDRRELAAVLHDALLTALGRSYELVQLAEALAVAARHESLRGATFGVALEILLDQQLDDGFVGVHRLLGPAGPAPANRGGADPAAPAQRALAALLEEIGRALAA